MPSRSGEVTELLIKLRKGDRKAETKLIPLVYRELRKLAAHYLKGERHGHTLQATALVHEAYLRLTQLQTIDWQSRSHFFAIAAQVMRRVLIDHARAHQAAKRGGPRESVSFDDALVMCDQRSQQLLALDAALDQLAKHDPRQSRIVELRFFGGLTEEEIGDLLGISPRTVKRDWRVAKAWLFQEINHSASN
jgi:RNA polymerase sigma-70 factor, ECF subfamily